MTELLTKLGANTTQFETMPVQPTMLRVFRSRSLQPEAHALVGAVFCLLQLPQQTHRKAVICIAELDQNPWELHKATWFLGDLAARVCSGATSYWQGREQLKLAILWSWDLVTSS